MKTESKSDKCGRSLAIEILDWLGFSLKLSACSKSWQLVWKSTGHIAFFVRHYDALPFRRYENYFPIEKKSKNSFNSRFVEFLGSVEAFDLEDTVKLDITSPVGWLENPLFGCKSLEEMRVKIDLLGARRR